MQTLNITAVKKRENFLIAIYSELAMKRTCLSFKERKLQKRVMVLISELRGRYNYKIVMTPVNFHGATPEMVSGNGKYALD